MKIYNTASKQKEEFIPVQEGKVSMYGCGVTPYKPSHLGHAMQAVIFDVIRRYFEYKSYKVTYVRNYTDIDDKIINAAKALGIEPLEHSKNIIKQCQIDFGKLRVRNADIEPKVSEHLLEIIALIETLIAKGHAYVTNKDNVYFSVGSFLDYGKLSNQNLEEVRHGTRKGIELDKQNPLDFALWKASASDEKYWDSPWGNGRPGWHIECSAMSTKYLGKHFDIHGGGGDLLFPHHENEIAQSKSANHGVFVNYWVHNGLLMVGNDKMSKSLNNDVAIKDWLEKYHPEVIRYLILTNHYRSHVQFVPARYVDANKKVYQTYQTLLWAKEVTKNVNADKQVFSDTMGEFETYMDNDFNTVPVIAMLHRLVGEIDAVRQNNRQVDLQRATAYLEVIAKIGEVLGLFDLTPSAVLAQMKELELNKCGLTEAYIKSTLRTRENYRKAGNFKESDRLRRELESNGIQVSDRNGDSDWNLGFTAP